MRFVIIIHECIRKPGALQRIRVFSRDLGETPEEGMLSTKKMKEEVFWDNERNKKGWQNCRL